MDSVLISGGLWGLVQRKAGDCGRRRYFRTRWRRRNDRLAGRRMIGGDAMHRPPAQDPRASRMIRCFALK
jgi:hypothetical protein